MIRGCVYLLIVFMISGCKRENKDTYQTYLEEKYKYHVKLGREINEKFERNGWIIEVLLEEKNGCATIREYAPASGFYEKIFKYYPDGTLKEQYQLICGLMFDEWRSFNEEFDMFGYVNASDRFWNSSIKHEHIIRLLEAENWFDRQTGENKIYPNEVLPGNGEFYRQLHKHFSIEFSPAVYKDGKEIKPPIWYIFITPDFDNGSTTLYTVDGLTGMFTIKEINNIFKDKMSYYSVFEWQWYAGNPKLIYEFD